jgi:hypothetical protein
VCHISQEGDHRDHLVRSLRVLGVTLDRRDHVGRGAPPVVEVLDHVVEEVLLGHEGVEVRDGDAELAGEVGVALDLGRPVAGWRREPRD